MKKNPDRKNKTSLLTKIILVFGALAIIAIAFSANKQIQKRKAIKEEIAILQEEIDSVVKENNDLGQKIQYFSTPEFKEKEAKDKLNMQLDGEEVVVIKPSPQSEEEFQETENDSQSEEQTRENWQRWYALFFEY